MPALSLRGLTGGRRFGVTYQLKDFFFDRPAIERQVERANKRNLSKAGAHIRTRARTSMRRRKAASAPGQPPSTHSTDKVVTLRNILFGFDPWNQSVVVGPVRLNQYYYLGPQLVSGTIPALHEFGGRLGIREKRVGNRWVSRGRRKPRAGQPTRVRLATYPARPYMGPAMEAELPKFPDLWANSVGAGA
jgi:hypothetical protein